MGGGGVTSTWRRWPSFAWSNLQKIAAAKKDKDQAIWTVEVAKAFGVMLRAVARCKAGGAAIPQTE